MPYMIVKKKEGDKQLWCVHKENADKKPGALVKCHESENDAKEHMAAMYANVEDAKSMSHYRKAITDAPELRGVASRSCWGCKGFSSLPSNAPGMPMSEGPLRGICSMHQFETSEAWVCDDWQDKWEEIEAAGKSESLVAFGGEVKSLGEGKIGGYLILFGSPDQADLTGDYFTKDTDFGPHKTSLVFYDHGLDGTVKRRVLDDNSTLKVDDVGVWVEAQIKMRDEYERAIHQLIKANKAGWSSGTASHLVERERKGNAWHITKWLLGLDASITVCPVEPRLASAVVPLKSLSAYPLEIQQAQAQAQGVGDGQPVAPSASSAESNAGSQPTQIQPQQSAATKSVPNKGVTMDEKEMQALVEKMGSLADAATKATDAATKAAESATKSMQAIEALIQKQAKTPATPEGGFVTGATKVANVQVTCDESDRPFKSLGLQLQAVRAAALDPANTDKRLLALNESHIKSIKAATGLNEGIPSEGGFLVQTDFAAELLKRVYEYGQITTRCRKIPISGASNSTTFNGIDETSRATGSRWGGVQVYWAAEGGSVTSKKPKFRQITLKLNKLMGTCYATDENLQDAAQLEAIITQAFPEEFDYTVEDAIVSGTGAGQPQGILNANCLVSVSKETGQAAKTIVLENVVTMWSRMWARSRPNSAWFINQDCEPQLLTMALSVGTGGVPAYMPPGGLNDTPYGKLMGRPVIPVEYCPTLGTVGDIILADFSQYMLADKGSLQSASSIHVQFLYDETVFRFIYRVDGQPIWNSALTPASGSSNTLSPFVVLATRA